jgi:flagellar protein FliO/FliZ
MTGWALLQALLALALVLALAWGAARLARRTRFVTTQGKRLEVIESLPLDQRRRMLVVRCDGRELLLLTGGAQDFVVDWLEEPRA